MNQDRRDFIKTAAIGAGVAVAAAAAPAIAQQRIEWRMVTTWPRNFPGLGVGAQRLADRITAMSDGRLTVKVYPAGELVPALQSFDAVIEGSAEMSHGAAYYWQNKSPATSFFTGVPYGMTSRELAGHGVTPGMVRISVGLEEIADLKNDFDRALRRLS